MQVLATMPVNNKARSSSRANLVGDNGGGDGRPSSLSRVPATRFDSLENIPTG